jgi:hypothetical protein
LSDGQSEITVLLPDRKYRGFWHRILHDQTADAIERGVSLLPHANVTTVPFHFRSRKAAQGTGEPVEAQAAAVVVQATAPNGEHPEPPPPVVERPDGTTPIGEVVWRQRVKVSGRVKTLRVQALAGAANLECVLDDGTGTLSIVFLGRNRIGGIDVGTQLTAEGVASTHRGRLAILNPTYQLKARR